MNDNRSPLGDKKLTFIGILSTVMIAVFFVLFNLNTKKYSDVEAATLAKSTEVTTEQQTTSTNPVEESTTKNNYYNNYLGEEKARVAHKSYVYDKYYGVPDSTVAEIESKVTTREEVVCSESSTIIDDTPEAPDNATSTGVISNKIKVTEAKEITSNKLDIIEATVTEDDDEEEEEETTESNMTYYGCLTLTAYTWTGSPCADGVYPTSGYTVACNNSDLWHKWVYIEGLGTYYVHDTGGMGWGVIDIYMDTYGECINFGVQSANIYVLN